MATACPAHPPRKGWRRRLIARHSLAANSLLEIMTRPCLEAKCVKGSSVMLKRGRTRVHGKWMSIDRACCPRSLLAHVVLAAEVPRVEPARAPPALPFA